MSRPPLNKRLVALLISLLMISLACNTLTSASPADVTPQNMIITRDIAYGSGPFNLPDPKVGLSDLSSYQATLTLSFDGTHDGRAEKWSRTYTTSVQKDPLLRQLTIETSGDFANADPVFMAEAEGADYQRVGENVCSASPIEAGKWPGEQNETVNDIASEHYTFDQRALGQQDLTKSEGEMWVASDGGYVIKYVLSTKADATYFGEGIDGTLTMDYELTGANKPVKIELPDGCPLGMVDAPQLPDATDVLSYPGVLSYKTSSSLNDALAFHQKELKKLGWMAKGDPAITENGALLSFSKGDRILVVFLATSGGVTSVNINLQPEKQQ
jgi:hypothetical protein